MNGDRPGPERPSAEVLDTGRPPGAVERWAGSLLQGRGAKVVGVIGVLLLGAGAWSVVAADDPDSPAAEGTGPVEPASADAPPGLRPPPARGREATTGTWKVTQDVAIRSSPKGHTVTFLAVNGGTEPQDPTRFQVSGGFVDRPGLDYQASCAGVELSPDGYRPLRKPVKPGQEVFVRCVDTTRYGAKVAWLDPKTVLVTTEPCEESGGLPGV